jgi:TBC1 domain family member 5
LPEESSSSNCEDKTVSEEIESGADVDRVRPLEKTTVPNERKPFINKLQLLLKFGRPSAEDNVVEKGSAQASSDNKVGVVPPCSSPANASSNNSCSDINLVYGNIKKVMGTLKKIGQNMLENNDIRI